MANELKDAAAALYMHRQVIRSYRESIQNVTELKKRLEKAEQHKKKMAKAMACKHHDVICDGGFIAIHSRCKKCGFTWYD